MNGAYTSAGPSEPGGTPVYFVDENVAWASVDALEHHEGVERLDPRTDLKNHSPSGFAWGYEGSGPAQLALALLAHAASEETALREYQGFKRAYVANADPDQPFAVTRNYVEWWLGAERQ